MSSAANLAKGGRKSGTKNYKIEALVDVVGSVLPSSTKQWERVGELYKITADDPTERMAADIRRTWMTKCCNGGKKPTGKSGPENLIK